MDTLVFLCQQTCTMVLPRWGAGLSSEVCDAAVSSSDSASTAESPGHSGKVRKLLLLLLKNAEGDEGERDAKTETQVSNVAATSAGFIWTFDPYFTFCSFFTSWKRVKTERQLHLLPDLLFPGRLLVRRSDESPLVVFAISIATLMSSIHFCISARELESKTTQLHINKIYQTTQSLSVLLEKHGQTVTYMLDHHL